MREVVMAMCERSGCAFVITFCEGPPPPFLSFFGFSLTMGFFGLMSLSNDIVILHINLYVLGSCVWAQGKRNRTRTCGRNKKLLKLEFFFLCLCLLAMVDMVFKNFFLSW